MATSVATTSLPCAHGIAISGRTSRNAAFSSTTRVAPVASPVAVVGFSSSSSSSRGLGNGRLGGDVLLQKPVFVVRRISSRRGFRIVAEEKNGDVFKAAGFLVKAGKNALDAGTDLIPDNIPRNIARIIVGVVGVSVITYFVRALFSTALFILAIGGFSYLAYIYLNKDNDSGRGGGSGGGGSSRGTEDSLEEARRIMDKYK